MHPASPAPVEGIGSGNCQFPPSAPRLALGKVGFRFAILVAAIVAAWLNPRCAWAARVEPVAQPFALERVRLLDGPFRDAMLRNQEYLLSLDPDRFLHMFRVTAGLPSTARPYGGWEAYRAEVTSAEARARETARDILDFVWIGDRASEIRHALKGERTQSGAHEGRNWRHAHNGGWFSYQIAVAPEAETILQATFWGSDADQRKFDVLVNDRKVATQTLEANAPGRFFDVQWPLTQELTGGQNRVTVRFQAHPGHIAGGLFGLKTLRPPP